LSGCGDDDDDEVLQAHQEKLVDRRCSCCHSTCWRAVTSAAAASGIALQRVNGFQTLLKFSGLIDAGFEFAFGLFRDAGYRSRDVAALKSPGMN
jgi:hypothetical protein